MRVRGGVLCFNETETLPEEVMAASMPRHAAEVRSPWLSGLVVSQFNSEGLWDTSAATSREPAQR